jgi:hypothetical protein
MVKLSNVSKIVIVAVVAAVLIILTIVYRTGTAPATTIVLDTTGNASLTAASPSQTSETTTGTGASSAGTATNHTSASNGAASAGPVITFVTPVKNDVWVIGTQDIISWNVPGRVTGSISLIDANTNQSVGVILPEIGPNQTSYTWNTRDVLLDRTNAQKKTVTPGAYMIRIAYDGNHIKPATSPAFTITN